MNINTQNQNKGKSEAELLAQLKSILLKDERQEIQKVQETIYTQENLSKEIYHNIIMSLVFGKYEIIRFWVSKVIRSHCIARSEAS